MHHRESGNAGWRPGLPRGFSGHWAGMTPPWGGNSVASPSEGSPAQVTRALSSSSLALSRCWAGGRRRSGSPGWRRSCRACSGCGRRSGTCSSRTARRGDNVSSREPRRTWCPAPAQRRRAHLDAPGSHTLACAACVQRAGGACRGQHVLRALAHNTWGWCQHHFAQ